MALRTGIRLRVATGSAVAVTLGAVALAGALATAAGARSDGRVLSQRLVPAAATAVDLLGLYQTQETWVRDYVTSRHFGTLAQFRAEAIQIRNTQDLLGRLTHGYGQITKQLNATVAAEQAWLSSVAGPQLAATGRGDFAAARRCRRILRVPGRTCSPSARTGRPCKPRSPACSR